MTLVELIDKAIHDIKVYRNPDVKELHEKLSEIFSKIGYPEFSERRITEIMYLDNYLYVCVMLNSESHCDIDQYSIPKFIINADDPLKEAAVTTWKALGRCG